MVNMLWEVAYGVCREVLCLDSLEDFNATEADLLELKNDILAMWQSRDRCSTSSLGPTFTSSSTNASNKRSTLADTFTPSRTVVDASTLHGSGLSLGEMSPSLSRPLGPLPGILYALMPSSYRQRIFPILTYSTVEPSMGYNFDPMMGQPLLLLTSSVYPFLSQSSGMPFPISTSSNPVGLLALQKLGEEEHPLVVGSPFHSS